METVNKNWRIRPSEPSVGDSRLETGERCQAWRDWILEIVGSLWSGGEAGFGLGRKVVSEGSELSFPGRCGDEVFRKFSSEKISHLSCHGKEAVEE